MANDSILVTGGAGYIGSHAVLALLEAGRRVVVVDDLSTGRRQAVPDGVPLVEGDVGEPALIDGVIRGHGVGAVVHFAGSIVVPESVADPLKYYRNNTAASRALLEACVGGAASSTSSFPPPPPSTGCPRRCRSRKTRRRRRSTPTAPPS